MSVRPYPWYYAVNDRPVKIVATPDGGADCLVFDFASGGFVPDRRYFTYVTPGSGKDVDQLDERGFEQLVAARRADASRRRRETQVQWRAAAEPGASYVAELAGRRYTLRRNAAPLPAYTLLLDDHEVEQLAELPPAWEARRMTGADRRRRILRFFGAAR